MELTQLKYFQAMAKCRHFTQAAEEMAVSQSALSRSIQKLEQELGVTLFERHGRTSDLTEAGQKFLFHVDRVIRELALAEQEIELDNGGAGVVHLSFLHSLGDTFLPLYGPGWIQDTLCGLTFRLSPAAFYQVNHDQAEILYRKALQFAALTGTETVLDLYCGTGTITLCLAREAGRAVGVEVVPQAIEDAKENAKRNGLADKTEFYCMDAGQAAQMFAARGERPDVIVVDPPRKGVSPDVIEAMAAMGPRRIVYVSCDPATLARDVKLLRERGYALQTAEAVDLFPRCAHVESVVLLSRIHA